MALPVGWIENPPIFHNHGDLAPDYTLKGRRKYLVASDVIDRHMIAERDGPSQGVARQVLGEALDENPLLRQQSGFVFLTPMF